MIRRLLALSKLAAEGDLRHRQPRNSAPLFELILGNIRLVDQALVHVPLSAGLAAGDINGDQFDVITRLPPLAGVPRRLRLRVHPAPQPLAEPLAAALGLRLVAVGVPQARSRPR